MAEKKIREMKHTARRVFLDGSSPSLASVIRTVAITLILIGMSDFVKDIAVRLSTLFFIVILSVFFAYLLDPLVRLIRRPFKERHLEKLMPRSLAIIISYVIVFLVVTLAVSYLAPRLGDQARQFVGNLPNYTETLRDRFENLNNRYENYQLPPEAREEVKNKVTSFLGELGKEVTSFAGTALFVVVSSSPWFILVPILSFFFLKDVNTFRVSLLRLFPSGRWRARAELFINDVNTTLAAYTRAQIISCFLIGTVCTIAFYLLDLNYALLLGILAGILEFIPLIGPLTLAITAITIAAFYSPGQAFSVALFLGVLRIVHDYVTYPRIVREGIHLHPLAIVLSVLAGEQIAGIAGVFLSIPAVAILTVVYKHIREHRKSGSLLPEFLEGEKAGHPPSSV